MAYFRYNVLKTQSERKGFEKVMLIALEEFGIDQNSFFKELVSSTTIREDWAVYGMWQKESIPMLLEKWIALNYIEGLIYFKLLVTFGCSCNNNSSLLI